MRKQTNIFLVLSGLLFLAGCGGNAPTPAAPTIREFPLPTPTSGAQWITAGPDGNLWFTGLDRAQIGRLTPAGQVTEFLLPSANSDEREEITAGPDGNLWFTEEYNHQIGRITPAGQITEFPLPATAMPTGRGITAGPDGNLWFTLGDEIGRMTPAGQVSTFPLPTRQQLARGGLRLGQTATSGLPNPLPTRLGASPLPDR